MCSLCAALERRTSFFESLSFKGIDITDSTQIKRLHSDRAKEFTALCFQKFLSNHRSIYHTLTTGYDPQANGTAERSVGLMFALSARCLTTSGLPQEFWSYAVKYGAQSLLCSSACVLKNDSKQSHRWSCVSINSRLGLRAASKRARMLRRTGGRNILNPRHGTGVPQPKHWASPLTTCVWLSSTSSSTKSHSLLGLPFTSCQSRS